MVIGLTGGAGSGKSFVSDIIKNKFGYPVIDSDSVTKELMNPGQKIYNQILEAFGRDLLDENQNIDRPRLASIVFNNQAKLLQLNSLTHPATVDEIRRRIKQYDNEGIRYIFVESAIPFEACYETFCDEFWYIRASAEDRAKRLKNTRGYSEEKIKSILNSQDNDEFFLKRCKRVIDNPIGCEADQIIRNIQKLIFD
jgi:dephospho-CoA kinase